MRGKLSQVPQQFLDDDGTPLNAGKVYYYVPDGTFAVEKTVYKNAAKSTSWTQPITLGADGRPVGADIFEDGDYDRKVFDADDNLIRSEQNIGDTWSAVGTDLNQNLVSNHSFETAGSGGEPFANWTATDTGSVITRDTSDPNHGAACALFTNSQNGNDYIVSDLFEISPSLDVFVSVMGQASNALAGPEVRVRYYTAAQSFISESTLMVGNVGTTWEFLGEYSDTPPSTARYAAIRLIGNGGATQYTMRFDRVNVYQKSTVTFGVVTRIPVGLNLSIDSGDTDHDITISPGAVLDSTYAKELVLTSELTKKIDAGWTAGDNAGGLAAGSSLSADGHVNAFIGLKSTTGQVDVFFADGDYDAPTPPSGFDFYRYLGRIPLDSSSNIVDGTWDGAYFTKLGDPAYEINSTVAYNVSTQTAEINAPPFSEVDYLARIEVSGGQASDLVVQVQPSDSSWDASRAGHGMEVTDIIDELHWGGKVVLNADSEIDWDFTIAGHTGNVIFQLNCVGWHDRKRDNP